MRFPRCCDHRAVTSRSDLPVSRLGPGFSTRDARALGASRSRLDARDLTPALLPEPPGLIVCDASFIGLAKVLAVPLSLAAADADLIALVKPQFEVGPQGVGKGGMVRDAQARADAVTAVAAWLESCSWPVQAEAESPILGGEGAREHLIWARRRAGG